MTTFLDLQDEALGDDFAPTKYRVLVKRWINEAQTRIVRRAQLRVSEETASYTATSENILLPTDFVQLRSVFLVTDATNVTGSVLSEISLVDLDGLDFSTGVPQYYALNATGLTLWPEPTSSALKIRYWRTPDALVSDGAVPEIPADYHHLLVTYARARLFRAEDDLQMWGAYMQEWEAGVAEAKAQLKRETLTNKQVPGLYSDAYDGYF